MIPTLYGIRNCDTVKKARAWLETNGVHHRFHDYKTEGVDPTDLRCWLDEHGWVTVLNRAGTTFRKLSDAERVDMDGDKATRMMLAQPSMIKRPVLDLGGKTVIGFKPEVYADALGR